MSVIPDDEVMICPFNPHHIILRHRMPYHIVKCKKNYTGPELVICHFNALHWVAPDKMKEHLEQCEDYRRATMEQDRKIFDEATKEWQERRSQASRLSNRGSQF
ncbi:gametocyte-specific factor 1-like [Culicoides brevitarsis]|uniref:gametocyte-specific factor 1-like n=1 Tax=Culicoides brevitarsis TaxID=469753 RepID=UPI00307B43EF